MVIKVKVEVLKLEVLHNYIFIICDIYLGKDPIFIDNLLFFVT